MYKNQITYYFQSGAVEGILALIFLFLIPTDPKNNWFLGYSKTRLLSSFPLLILVCIFLLLVNYNLKQPGFANWLSPKLDSLVNVYGYSLPVLLLLFGSMVIGPYFKTVTYIPVEEIKIRLLPFILYLSSRYLQLTLVLTVMIKAERKRGIQWRFSNRNLTAILLTISGILVAAHLSLFILHGFTKGSLRYREIWQLNRYFNLTYEMNLPAFFAVFLISSAGFILGIIAINKIQREVKFRIHWSLLSIIFFLLAIDELLAKHENLGYLATNYFGEENLLFQDWAYAGIVLVILFTIFFLPFFNHLPPDHKKRFFISAALYIGGALGAEIVSSYLFMRYGFQEITYVLATSLEETLEMVGVIYFIHSLWIYLDEFGGSKIRSNNVRIGNHE